MGKKFQVVLPDWMENYLQMISKKYDLTISELLRLDLSLSFICFIKYFYPEYKGIEIKDLGIPVAKDVPALEKIDRERMHRILSRIYFEARKAADFHINAEMKKLK